MINVAVVDDQPLLVSAFTALVRAQPDMQIAGTAANGQEALALVRSRPIDVMIMDIRMPVLDGVTACRAITEQGETPRVLMLTTFDVDEYVIDAVQAGARGFLLKDAEPEELIKAVRDVHAGEAAFAPRAATHLLDDYTARPVRAPHADAVELLERLTEREREVLGHIARGSTNGEIAAGLFIAETTVKTHVGNLLEKLECRDRVALVVLAHAAGVV